MTAFTTEMALVTINVECREWCGCGTRFVPRIVWPHPFTPLPLSLLPSRSPIHFVHYAQIHLMVTYQKETSYKGGK